MALIIYIKVIPGSGKQRWALDKSGQMKCYLKSQPEKGLANKELLSFLSKTLRIPQSDIMIVAGDTARKKKIKIETELSQEKIFSLLGLDMPPKQEKLF